jgi:hypothetical protein
LPYWINFNKDNRTIYGIANETGTFNIDYVFIDSSGLKSFSNVRLAVTPKNYNKYSMIILYLLSTSIFAALGVFFIYLWQFNFSLLPSKSSQKYIEQKIAKEARIRFSKYKGVDLKYY